MKKEFEYEPDPDGIQIDKSLVYYYECCNECPHKDADDWKACYYGGGCNDAIEAIKKNEQNS